MILFEYLITWLDDLLDSGMNEPAREVMDRIVKEALEGVNNE